MNSNLAIPDSLYTAIHKVIKQARQQVRQAVNQQMVQAYWHIGRLIVEQEQWGQERAEYGKQQLAQLSKRLQNDFGKGFDDQARQSRYRWKKLGFSTSHSCDSQCISVTIES